jgi:hypothetical protein
MSYDREEIAEVFEAVKNTFVERNWGSVVDYFTDDCVFINPLLPEPIEGKAALRAFTDTWPDITNRVEWDVIDNNRAVACWVENPPGVPLDGVSYRGVSAWTYAGNGLFSHYEGFFDTANYLSIYEALENE